MPLFKNTARRPPKRPPLARFGFSGNDDNSSADEDQPPAKIQCPMCCAEFSKHTSLIRHLGVQHGYDEEGRLLSEEQLNSLCRRSRKAPRMNVAPPPYAAQPPAVAPPPVAAPPPVVAPPMMPTPLVQPVLPIYEDISDTSQSTSTRSRRSARLRDLGLDLSVSSQSIPSSHSSPDRQGPPHVVDSRGPTPMLDEPARTPTPPAAPTAAAAGLIINAPTAAHRPLTPDVIIIPGPSGRTPPPPTRGAAATAGSPPRRPSPRPSTSRLPVRQPPPPADDQPRPSTSAVQVCRRLAGDLQPVAVKGKALVKRAAAPDPCVRRPTQPDPVRAPPVRPATSGQTHHTLPAGGPPRRRVQLTHAALLVQLQHHPDETVDDVATRLAAEMGWNPEERQLHTDRLYDIRRTAAAVQLQEKQRIPLDRTQANVDAYFRGYDCRLAKAQEYMDTMEER